MAWGYVAVAAAGAYSSYQSGKGADAQRDAANMSIEQKRRNFALIRKDTRMSRMSGQQAQMALNDMMGLKTENPYDEKVTALQEKYDAIDSQDVTKKRRRRGFGKNLGSINIGLGLGKSRSGRSEGRSYRQTQKDAALAGVSDELDPLKEKQKAFNEREQYDFKGSPGYQFRLAEGYQGLERSQAGRRLGGRALKEAQRYGQGFATREYEAQFNRLSTIANRGQQAVSISAGLSPNTLGEAQIIGNAGAQDAGNQAEIVGTGLSQANAWNNYNQGLDGNNNTATSGSLY